MYGPAGAPAGHEVSLPGCRETLQGKLEGGGMQYPHCEWNCMGPEPSFSGETGWPGTAAQAQQCATAGDSCIQPAVTVYQLSGGAWTG